MTTHLTNSSLPTAGVYHPKRWSAGAVLGTGPKYIRLPGKVIYRPAIEAYEKRVSVLCRPPSSANTRCFPARQ